MKSIFADRALRPTGADLENALGDTVGIWRELTAYTNKLHPGTIDEWHYTSEKYGWSFRLSDKKRVLLYLLPRDKFFKAAFVFGQKATDAILQSDIANPIREEIQNARAYAEGRGIRIDIRNNSLLEDLKKLISIKVSH